MAAALRGPGFLLAVLLGLGCGESGSNPDAAMSIDAAASPADGGAAEAGKEAGALDAAAPGDARPTDGASPDGVVPADGTPALVDALVDSAPVMAAGMDQVIVSLNGAPPLTSTAITPPHSFQLANNFFGARFPGGAAVSLYVAGRTAREISCDTGTPFDTFSIALDVPELGQPGQGSFGANGGHGSDCLARVTAYPEVGGQITGTFHGTITRLPGTTGTGPDAFTITGAFSVRRNN